MTQDPIKKKLNELEKKIDTTSFMMFSYIQAMLHLLNDKELTTQDEFKERLEQSKKVLTKLSQDAQFLQTMKDFLPKKDKEKE